MLQVKDKDGLTGTASKSVQILAEDDFPPRYVLVLINEELSSVVKL